MRSKELSLELRDDSVEAQIWVRVPNNFGTTIILKWKKFGTTNSLPKAGHQSKLSNRGRRALDREVTKNTRVPLWRWENLLEGQPSLQHSTNQAFIVEWPDRSHSSVKGTWQPAWSLPIGTWRTIRPWETRFSGLMKLRFNYLAWMPRFTSGGNLEPSLRWRMVVRASCCWDVFQEQGLGD